jgi:NhaA family Na+:H+ antiporter
MSRAPEFVSEVMWTLPAGCVAALIWANTSPDSYYPFAMGLSFFVNQILLAFFLGLIAKEVMEATLPGGPLHSWRRAALPLATAIGGALVPIGVFFLFLHTVGDVMLRPAWGATCAADIAAIYVASRFVLGRHAGTSFLLLLSFALNAIGMVAVIATTTISMRHAALGIMLMAFAMGAAIALRRTGVRHLWYYLLGPGVLSWLAFYQSGWPAALALIPIVPFMPHASRDAGFFVDAPPQTHDTLTGFGRWARAPVEGILLLFGLINAGVPLHGIEEGSWAVPVAVIIGRPIGVLIAARLAVTAGLHLPFHVRWGDIAVIGCLASIGFVMTLFFAGATMATGPLLQELKTGALMTAAGAIVALVVARLFRAGRFTR